MPVIESSERLSPAPAAAPERGAPVLDISGLSVTFRGKHPVRAVDDVSFSIDRGEIVALVGESGSGKSVTSLATLGLLAGAPKVEGAIRFHRRDGTAVDLTSPAAARAARGPEIAMIFQEPMTSLNPVFTVGEQIAEGVRLHEKLGRRAALDRAREMLNLVGIPDPDRRLKAYPHEMSGGMRQRVMIAIALACRPSLLIADEPTTALDVTIQAQILDLIRRLQADIGLSVLFITHDLGVVAELAARTVVMYAGQVVESGETGAVLAAPRHPYTRGLIASVPVLRRAGEPRRRVHPIPGQPPDLRRRPTGCAFHPRCGSARAGLCDIEDPPLERVDDHPVRCLRWRELPPARPESRP
ncbi:ABC transporter ATP-binding protein [Acuticoccus kandeliae]|uniref:ABC transporter ATP-binding protein n=1 Tax=Acuticoccus kandeliae TaxID=2073160 RepID=UPI000D3E2E38|nr:ABC transporter ATP-binding protein [Acuticoccus kandeliae]